MGVARFFTWHSLGRVFCLLGVEGAGGCVLFPCSAF